MNYARKMWKRILSVMLAVAVTLTLIPFTETYATGGNSIDLAPDAIELDITAENPNPSEKLTLGKGYDADGNQLADGTVYSITEVSSSDPGVVTVSDTENEITVTAAGRGTANISVTVSATPEGAAEALILTGTAQVDVWETPLITITPEKAESTYPEPVTFQAAADTGATCELAIIKEDGTDVTDNNGKALAVGTYTITASVAEDASNYYRENSVTKEYTVTKGTVDGLTTVIPNTVYWNEMISFKLPDQTVEGTYNVTVENLTPQGDLPTTAGADVQLKADQEIGDAKISVSYIPQDTQNYDGFTHSYTIAVKKVPVEASWQGSYTKTYDGSTDYSILESPTLSFAGAEGDSYTLPETLKANGNEFAFTLDCKDAGVQRTATLNTDLTLSDTSDEQAADHYELINLRPTVPVTVTPIQLKLDQIECTPEGKFYDGTSVVKFAEGGEPHLVANANMPDDYSGISLTCKAHYKDAEGKEFAGDPEEDTTASKVVLSELDLNSPNYQLVNETQQTVTEKIIEGSYQISKNAGFMEFTSMDSLGSGISVETINDTEMEIHWFNDEKTANISKSGFLFSTDSAGKDNAWKETYQVESTDPVKIYAKNTENGLVSGGIYVALDNTSAEGQFFAKIEGEGDPVSISEAYSEKYQILKGGKKIEIQFQGTDDHSKITKIEVYGSDTPWSDYNVEAAWNNLADQKTTMDVNADSVKTTEIEKNIYTVESSAEFKKFYYARVTDFAGNVSYISSSGVLQDITSPEAVLTLTTENGNKSYTDEKGISRQVYGANGEISFEIGITDSGISSGIAAVELELKDYSEEVLRTYTADSENLWEAESAELINAIKALNKEDYPTDAQIEATLFKETDGQKTAQILKGKFAGDQLKLDDGYYTLSAVLTDKVGHESAKAEISFIVDNEAPVVSIENRLDSNPDRTKNNLYTGGSMELTIKELTLDKDNSGLFNKTDVLIQENDKAVTEISVPISDWDTKTDSVTGMVTYTTTLEFGNDQTYQEGNYAFSVKASDAVTENPVEEPAIENADYFVIDYTKPAYTVTFSETDENAYRSDRNKLYYGKNHPITAVFTIEEETSYDDDLITILAKNSQGTEVIAWENGRASVVDNDKFVLEHEEGTKKYTLTIKADPANDDDGYTFSISGNDMAGNVLAAKENNAGAELAKHRVMDATAPELTKIDYDTADEFNSVGDRDYVNDTTNMTFHLTEHNPMSSASSVTSEGKLTNVWSGKNDQYTTTIKVPQLGEKGDEQEITLNIMDKAGNKAVLETGTTLRSQTNTAFSDGVFTDKFTVDTVPPEIKLEYVAFNPVRPNIDGIDYFKQGITLKVTVDEHNFNEGRFIQPVEITGSKVGYTESSWENDGDIHVKTFTFSKDNQYNLSVKGTDNAKNTFKKLDGDVPSATLDKETVKASVAVDSTLPAIGDTAKPIVVITPGTVQGQTTDGEALYNTDITYEVVVYDPLLNKYASGIHEISFNLIGEDGTAAHCTVDKAGNISDGNGVSITRVSGDVSKLAKGVENKYVFHVTVSSKTFNTNGIVLSVSAEDVSTNMTKDVKTAPVAIDTTAPKVVVSYDNNDVSNEKYFHDTRVATVKVTERNFSNDCLQFLINGTDAQLDFQLESAGSGNRDDAVWVASYMFDIDGDYEIEVICKDRAQNEGTVEYVGEAPQDFTIDKTIPIITVDYDNNSFQNEYYYKEARIATVTIEEHNFSANDVVITMTATDDGRTIAVPGVAGWSDEGDYHRATIRYDYDADFTFDIEYADLATNEAADYEQDHFVVDMTAPELEIFDIENMSANNGVVRPGIRYYDTNYDKDGTVIQMTGYHNGAVEMTGERKLEPNGLELKLNDFEYVQEMDDIYTMHATVYDLAGNSSEENVMFSVNRFGSVYTFDEKTDDLIGDNGRYYTNKEQELVITETNVDTLEFKEITCNLNGKLETLKEGQDYTVSLNGSEATWKQYTYTLKEDNFAEEGTYILTIYSEDRATNTSDNSSKGKKIEFVVDKTNPSVLISGVENNGQYRTNSREMTLDIEDNVRLSQVAVTIDGTETVYDAAQIQEADGKFVMNIGSANHWQDIEVAVTDAAGNEEVSEEMRVLVTANIFVQYFMNKPLFYGSLGTLAAIAALLWWFLIGKKKKENEEAK